MATPLCVPCPTRRGNQTLEHGSLSARSARRFTEQTLADWGITERLDDVRLCVSELVTNALVHGCPDTGSILLRFTVREGLLRVEVRDGVAGVPQQGHPGDDKESGRGLLLVGACADGWGVERQTTHKIVWAEFKIHAAPVIAELAHRASAA